MKSTALVFWLVLAVAATVSYGGWIVYRHSSEKSAPSNGLEAESAAAADEAARFRMNLPAGPSVPDFKLTDQNGREFDSSEMRGKVWVASFFFASCPGTCYQLNQALAGLQAEQDLDAVRFVSITCDAENDTPDVLRQYAGRFSADPKRWSFLTGEESLLQKIANQSFGVALAPKTHTNLAVALDREGRIRGQFYLTSGAEVIQLHAKLRKLLAEKPAGGDSATATTANAKPAVASAKPAELKPADAQPNREHKDGSSK